MSWFHSQQGQGNFLFSKSNGTAVSVTQPPIQWVSVSFLMRLNKRGVKNKCDPNSIPPYNYMQYTGINLCCINISLYKGVCVISAEISRHHILGHKCIWRYYGSPLQVREFAMFLLMAAGNTVPPANDRDINYVLPAETL